MSLHTATEHKNKIGTIVQSMIDAGDQTNLEVLVYFEDEDNEWKITKDRRYFSHGFKLEDKINHLEKLISKIQSGLKHAQTAKNLHNTQGIIRDVQFEINESMSDYKNNDIEWA